ncbi:uncharacterized protein LOC100175030 [Ciona intestinalis]
MNLLLMVTIFCVMKTIRGISLQKSTSHTFEMQEKRFVRSLVNQARLLSDWTEWSACNATICGIVGVQERYRNCSIAGEISVHLTICGQELHQAKPCEMPCITNQAVSLGSWNNWGSCSVSCGRGGVQTRQRDCLQILCTERFLQQRNCIGQNTCPQWSQWQEWSECSRSCGMGGVKIRERSCQVRRNTRVTQVVVNDILKRVSSPRQSSIQNVNASLCEGGDEVAEDAFPCMTSSSCRRNWSSWQPWSSCSATCGTGFSSGSRVCSGRIGSSCLGRPARYRRCYSPPCWSSWSGYTPCSISCGTGGGYRTRRRECRGTSTRVPQYMTCRGSNAERELCNTETCPVWGQWSRFDKCSKTCGSGRKMRTRTCVSGICRGRKFDVVSCNYQPCPYWSQWSSYTCCSVTCGPNGTKERTRACRHGGYRRAPFMNSCVGEWREQTNCSMHPCNVTPPSVFDTFECGVRNRRQTNNFSSSLLRIFGGQQSGPHGWPWQASWQYKNCNRCSWSHFCGATLVAPRWVIIAAHCIEESAQSMNHDNPGDLWSIVVGMHRFNEDGERYFIRRAIVHPNYIYRDVTDADIALVELRSEVPLTTEVVPVCLPQFSQPTVNETCFITGWGYTGPASSVSSRLSTTLLEAEVPIMNFTACQMLSPLYQEHLNSTNHMCAGDPVTAATDSCLGDSGGPLTCQRPDNTWYISGVTSFGFVECGTPGHVGIYTPLISFEEWVRTTIENNTYAAC